MESSPKNKNLSIFFLKEDKKKGGKIEILFMRVENGTSK